MRNNLFKRVISLVIALMMILSGTQVLFAVSLPTDEIELNKTATPVEGEENTYNIQLSVKGKDIDTGKKVDVILVIDNSASMFNSKYEGITLGKITEEAAKAFVDGVLTQENNENIRIAVVKYGEQAKARIFSGSGSWSNNWSNELDLSDEMVYTSVKADAINAIVSATEPTTDEGTNTEGGFLMAKKVAEVKRANADSIVIFMTDGLPTYRYDGTGSNTTHDGSGSQTSMNELNEAIAAAQDLDIISNIYTVGLFSAFELTDDEVKLASNLLSMTPKTYKKGLYTYDNRILQHVNNPERWTGVTPYAYKYYPIYAGDDASGKMGEIYEGFAGDIYALAHGYVTDVIPKDFQLTDASKNALELLGIVPTENADGTTTLVFPGISAREAWNDLPEFTVEAKPGVYGTGFTNEEAFYIYTLYSEEDESEPKYFEKPIVPINPTAVDDSYSILQDEILTLTSANNILKNDEILKLEDGEYTVSELAVDDEYVTDITTTEGGTAVLQADGTFVYTPPSGFTGTDTFVYKNKATVLGEGPLAKDYESSLAIVTITVYPTGTEEIDYTIIYLVQESNKVLDEIHGVGYPGQLIEGNAKGFSGYRLATGEPNKKQITLDVESGNIITFLYVADSTGGGGGGGTPSTIIEDPEIPLAELEKVDHFAYIIGYPEGDIRPMNNITREEVAMIFYRLLTDESRDSLLTDANPFTDVESSRWSNRAISTLYNADIISGYPDGTFRPSAPITRAEFATIAAKFDKLELGSTSKFTDIFGHWAEKYITSSEVKGWIKGYPDMTFKPEQDIRRAEAMTLINNVLERLVPEENIHPDAMFWPDNPKEEWYFEAVMEATNSHDYVYEDDGDELWTGMKPNKVWP